MTWTRERRGAVVVLGFDRPPENLLSFALLDELDAQLLEVSSDPTVAVVMLTGLVPGYFVGHADLGDVGHLVDGTTPSGSPDSWITVLARLAALRQPVVAAVNGQAWGGGCELALAAQLRVAARSASFAFVEVAAGAMPGGGGTQRLPRLVGPSRAARMILSGDVVGADDALALGLVDAVLPDEDFLDAALAWVEPIALRPPHALAAAKRALVDGLQLPLVEGIAREQQLFRALLRSAETRALFAEHG